MDLKQDFHGFLGRIGPLRRRVRTALGAAQEGPPGQLTLQHVALNIMPYHLPSLVGRAPELAYEKYIQIAGYVEFS